MPAIRSKIWLVVFTLFTTGLLACSDSTGPGGGGGGGGGDDDSRSDLSGEWAFDVTLDVADYELTCSADSRLSLTQASGRGTIGGTFSDGKITCTYPGGSESGEFTGQIQGTRNGDNVSFTDDEGCAYEGTVGGNDNRMQGTVTCPDVEGAAVRGTWSATLTDSD